MPDGFIPIAKLDQPTAPHFDTLRLKALEACRSHLQTALTGPRVGATVPDAADYCCAAADRSQTPMGHDMAIDALAAALKHHVRSGYPVPKGIPERMVAHAEKKKRLLQGRDV